MGQIFSDEYNEDDIDASIDNDIDIDGDYKYIDGGKANDSLLKESSKSSKTSKPLVGGRVPFHVAIHAKKMKSMNNKVMNCKKTANEIVRLYSKDTDSAYNHDQRSDSANAPISNMFVNLQLDSSCLTIIKDTLQEKKICMEKVPFEEWTTQGPKIRFRGPTEYVKIGECQIENKIKNENVAYVAMSSGTPNISMWKEPK